MLSRRKKRSEFEDTALPHLNSLYGAAVRLTRNPRDAEDLVQDAMLRAYRFWGSFEQGSNCKAWLFRILTNTFINSYQKTKRRREVLDAAVAEQSVTDGVLVQEHSVTQQNPEEMLLDHMFSDDVTHALEALPPDFRVAVVLCDIEGFSYKEIAEIMECPVGTVMSRLHRGRRLLAESLREFAVTQGVIKAPLDTDTDADADTDTGTTKTAKTKAAKAKTTKTDPNVNPRDNTIDLVAYRKRRN